MKKIGIALLGLCGVLFFITIAQTAPIPSDKGQVDTLIKEADRARGAAAALEGLTWLAEVETIEGNTNHNMTYFIKVKDNNATAEVKSPARNKGEVMLFNDRNIWFFKSGLKKPVSISPRQKLMGQASNGDIASTNYFRDYSSKYSGEETVNGIPSIRLDLKAKAKNVTYDKIRYWVSSKDHVGVKAEFLTVGGDVFKRAYFEYGNALSVENKSFPFISKMTIVDAHNPDHKTILSYTAPKVENFSASSFNVNNMAR